MWYENCTFYQIYTLGFCNSPKENNGITVNRINHVNNYLDHFKKLGIGAIYFCPVFESDRHGYDTRDYKKIDCRLGTNDDFKAVCTNLHNAGINIVLDGVFNHVGRGFFAFKDVLQNKTSSIYKDWFNIDFNGNSCYNDGFYYEGWEGHYELVKLNLKNHDVIKYLFECINYWITEFDIDGIRLDVAYCLDKDFLRQLRSFCNSFKNKPEFLLIGEVLFGDYNQIANDEMCHSVTNYECYKGLHSSFNSLNMFEISHSLQRQFGVDNWCIYRNKHFLSFTDNHDVSRIASLLNDKNHLPLIYALLFGMPGIPCIYYGSEWGTLGKKEDGDDALRLYYETPQWNHLTDIIASLIKIRKENMALCYGSYKAILLTNKQLLIAREYNNKTTYIGINIDNTYYHIQNNHINIGNIKDLITNSIVNVSDGYTMAPYSFFVAEPV